MRQGKYSGKPILYYLVAFYIGYMGCLILKNRFTGDETLSYPLAVAIASVLLLGAAGIICYTFMGTRNKEEEKGKEESLEEKEPV